MANTCGGCPTTWAGQNIAHCANCHETFSVPALFDRHRLRYRCVHPSKLRHAQGVHSGQLVMRQNDRDTWVGNQENPYANERNTNDEQA